MQMGLMGNVSTHRMISQENNVKVLQTSTPAQLGKNDQIDIANIIRIQKGEEIHCLLLNTIN